MIPEGTDPNVTIIVLAVCIAAGSLLLGLLFWYRFTPPRVIMSREGERDTPQESVARTVAATPTKAAQRIAKADNAANEPLTGNGVAAILGNDEDDITEAREIIRRQALAEATARLINEKKWGQTDAIEFVFNCTRTGRPESVYQKARAAVLPLVQTGPQFAPLDDHNRQVPA